MKHPNLSIQINGLHTFLSLILLFLSLSLYANPEQEFPVLYKGRYRPAEAYARVWLYDLYHSPVLKKDDFKAFKTNTSSPLALLWSFDILGYAPYQNAPLFWIGSADLKKLMDLTPTRNRFSYQECQHLLYPNSKNQEAIIQRLSTNPEGSNLFALLKEFERLSGISLPIEKAFRNRWVELQEQALPPKEIQRVLEQEYPLSQRLRNAGTLFKSLPSRYKPGEWLSLKALKAQVYQPSSQTLQAVGNFTLFSNEDFETIRQAYLTLEKAFIESNQERIQEAQHQLASILQQAYQSLSGKITQEAYGKQLTYPTLTQLKMETLYVSYPWIPLLILLYAIAAFSVWISSQQKFSKPLFAIGIMILPLLCHTALLAIRCYILERPPVSNMFETVIYVPWVATLTSLLFPAFRRQPLALLAACLISIVLLVILEVTDLNQSLDQVQAVLDSQFWLLIHVLLVVGSYGIFILGAILGHFYLGLFIAYRKESETMQRLSQIILQTLYGGTTLLITGTLLGGVWAAESWGRFWDWDPKESWAFISCCFYLIWIHAYRFRRIASFGLAIGAVSGLLAISFTWYGVNYLLGTGLHSYGFGSGGQHYYYAFVCMECLFLAIALWTYFRNLKDKMIQNKIEIC